ncbi:hypothetical protein [Streptomyces sp. NPDC051684]|uniref:hypothetical protein n=1 Tax=Streptomyces sp. NPDC051684 TaxID=3365670 RepID=UPI00378D9946
MRVRELAEPCTFIDPREPLTAAADLLADQRLPALLIQGARGRPTGMLSAGQLIGACLPSYVALDPLLARVVDEAHADQLRVVPGRVVADCRAAGRARPPSIAVDRTVMELAEVMARTDAPLVVVTEPGADGDARPVGAVTAARLLASLRQGPLR